jgi:hypothetical protein
MSTPRSLASPPRPRIPASTPVRPSTFALQAASGAAAAAVAAGGRGGSLTNMVGRRPLAELVKADQIAKGFSSGVWWCGGGAPLLGAAGAMCFARSDWVVSGELDFCWYQPNRRLPNRRRERRIVDVFVSGALAAPRSALLARALAAPCIFLWLVRPPHNKCVRLQHTGALCLITQQKLPATDALSPIPHQQQALGASLPGLLRQLEAAAGL